MPKSLEAIEKAADLLEQACKDMKRDPYSKAGRDRLIAGSRGILQGTTAMLVFFDESQVNVNRLNSATAKASYSFVDLKTLHRSETRSLSG
jgi:hypothetical protein